MEKRQIDILANKSGKESRTVFRAIKDLELSGSRTLSKELENLVVIYLKIEGANRTELRQTIKKQILLLNAPKEVDSINSEFKDYLLEQSKLKDKQIKRKEKQVEKYSEAIVGLSNKLLSLVDDISMLRVQDTGTIQRLYDKNVLADLLTDLEPGSTAYNAIKLLLDKTNQKN